MNPTQEQLAALAATILAGGSDKPPEAVAMALEVWKEAGKVPAAQKAREAEAELRAREAGKDRELMAKLSGKEGNIVPFYSFLRHAVDPKTDRSEARYRDFLRYQIRSHSGGDIADETVEDEVAKRYAQQHEEGFLSIDAWFLAWDYRDWWQREKARNATDRGKKGPVRRAAKKAAAEEAAAEEAAVKKAAAKKAAAKKAAAKKAAAKKAAAKKTAAKKAAAKKAAGGRRKRRNS